ncbi:hypothetical protein Scep_031067 [Stephania cephalantha]|uniref:Uncharacterized protein n=1 Tax=Stephania cephalantha TaxID=152367 RepID=A0AAP0HDY3_9MAGN
MPLEPRASWFSPKCVEAQQLTGHLGVKHCFGAGRESGTKSRQTLNTRYDPKGSRSASETMGDKLHRREGNSPDHQLRPLNDRSVIKEVKEVGDLMTGEPATEAPVNGGRNYNGPKASQKVTEACKGFLGPDGDWPSSAKAEGSLTARPTRRAGTKVGLSDPTVPSGRAVAQRIKVTLGITGFFPRVHIDGKVWHLDVGSSPPGAVVCSKGWAVRPLKRYVSWVQNVVRQFGPYPVWALEH